MVSLSFTSLTTLINRDDFTAFSAFLNNRNVALDDRDENGTTALMVAAEKGKVNFVHALIQFGADVNLSDLDNWTALHNAAKEGHSDCITELLDAGARLDARDMGGWSALMWSVYRHHEPACSLLLSRDAPVNSCGQHNITALALASARGDSSIVQLLLNHGAKCNINDKFGTSPLIWACRKGYTDIVKNLLLHSANADVSGMYSWTPLLTSVKAGHAQVVDLLIGHKPNLNALDADGMTSLIVAAKDGNFNITSTLANAGAYINIQDKTGDTCLISAARSGHVNIVELLLKKYAELNLTGKEHKTALYWAVEKNHVEVVKLLLNAHADTEIPTKDGDTALLRAVRNRNSQLVQLLLDKRARISATDIKGDTCLHIAMRARSKKIVEILLRNPKHSKLLYRPNKAAETAYNIDLTHKPAILADVFGARKLNTNEENENRLGYELYSSTVADFLCEPSLTVPITVGLYAKWGSGKSFLLAKLTEEMRHFTQQWYEPVFKWSTFQLLYCVHVALLVCWLSALVFGGWTVAACCTAGAVLLQAVFTTVISHFGHSWENKRMYLWNTSLASHLSYMRLIYQMTFCQPAGSKFSSDEPSQIRFFFADRTKVLASGRGDVGVAHMLSSLSQDIETRCGRAACRLFRSLRPSPVSADSAPRWRSMCFVPYLFVFLATVYAVMLATLLCVHYFNMAAISHQPISDELSSDGAATYTNITNFTNSSWPRSVVMATSSSSRSSWSQADDTLEWGRVTVSLVLALVVLVVAVILVNIVTISTTIYCLLAPHSLFFKTLIKRKRDDEDRYIESLKSQVLLLTGMVRTLDSFTGERSRMVLVIDGMDSCEQNQVIRLLDIINTLFTLPDYPFVILFSLDPHIISKAVELNISKAFRRTALGGNEYLKNLIHLPFFLQNAALRKVNLARKTALQYNKKDDNTELDAVVSNNRHMSIGTSRRFSGESTSKAATGNRLRLARRLHSSRLRSTDSVVSSVSSNLNRLGVGGGVVEGSPDINRVLLTDDYFSDINPRTMRRLMNVVYVTGRLVKSFNIEFSWYHLASWMNIVEQWPYRVSWLIVYLEYNEHRLHNHLSLHELYLSLRVHIPVSHEQEPLTSYDRDEKKLETFLSFHKHTLTVAVIKIFLPFTINLDPYLKKMIKDVYMEPVGGQFDIASTPAVRSTSANISAHHHHHLGHQQRSLTSTFTPPVQVNDPGQSSLTQQQLLNQLVKTASIQPSLAGSLLSQLLPQTADSQQLSTLFNTAATVMKASSSNKHITLPSWCLQRHLDEMTVDDVCHLVSEVGTISPQNTAVYHERLCRHNITGWVLSACNLHELKKTLEMTFGDWEMFSACIVQMREMRQCEGHDDHVTGVARGQGQVSGLADCQRPIQVHVTTESGHVSAVHSSPDSEERGDTETGLSRATDSKQTHHGCRASQHLNLERQLSMHKQSDDEETPNACFSLNNYLLNEARLSICSAGSAAAVLHHHAPDHGDEEEHVEEDDEEIYHLDLYNDGYHRLSLPLATSIDMTSKSSTKKSPVFNNHTVTITVEPSHEELVSDNIEDVKHEKTHLVSCRRDEQDQESRHVYDNEAFTTSSHSESPDRNSPVFSNCAEDPSCNLAESSDTMSAE